MVDDGVWESYSQEANCYDKLDASYEMGSWKPSKRVHEGKHGIPNCQFLGVMLHMEVFVRIIFSHFGDCMYLYRGKKGKAWTGNKNLKLTQFLGHCILYKSHFSGFERVSLL